MGIGVLTKGFQLNFNQTKLLITGDIKMSFTNQKPFVVTSKDLKLPWGGYRDGRKFKCGLCGIKFKEGDTIRWSYNGGKGVINFFVCQDCDTDHETIITRRKELEEERKKLELILS